MEKSWKEKLRLYLLVYTIGLLFAVAYFILRIRGDVKIQGKLPKPNGRSLVVVSNHPSTVETLLLIGLLSRLYLLSPRLAPWSTPTMKHFSRLSGRIWNLMQERAILVPEGRAGLVSWFRRMGEIIGGAEPAITIIFPEGNRTFLTDSVPVGDSGQRLGPVQPGVATLIARAKVRPLVLPIWVEGADRVMPNSREKLVTGWPQWHRGPIVLRIGKPIDFPAYANQTEISQGIFAALSGLAGQCSIFLPKFFLILQRPHF